MTTQRELSKILILGCVSLGYFAFVNEVTVRQMRDQGRDVVDETSRAVASCADSLDRCQARATALRRSILFRAFSGQFVHQRVPGQ